MDVNGKGARAPLCRAGSRTGTGQEPGRPAKYIFQMFHQIAVSCKPVNTGLRKQAPEQGQENLPSSPQSVPRALPAGAPRQAA